MPASATTSLPEGGPQWRNDRPEVVGEWTGLREPGIPGTEVAGTTEVKVLPAQPKGGFDPERSREDTSKRTAHSTEFVNPDGTRTLRLFAGKRFKPTSDGALLPVDTTLQRSADGRVRPRHAAPLSIAGTANDSTLVSIDLANGATASFALDLASSVPVDAPELKVPGDGLALVQALAPDADLGLGKAVFRGIRPDADLEVTTAAWGVKEDLVLHSVNAPRVWDFTLRLTGGLRAELDERTGSVLFKDANGVAQGVIPPGFMVDSNIDPRSGEGVRSNGVKYVLSERDGAINLRIELDSAWLDDPARQYPVIVDPTIRDSVDVDDTYVMTNSPAVPSAWEQELKVGTYDGGGHIAASFLSFTDTIHGLRNHQIHGATLNLHEIYSFCCPAQARPMWVFPVTESWDANLASWPGPAFDGNAVGSVNASYGTTPAWLSIPLPADRMTRWTHWMENFHGFRLAADYGDSYGWKRFSSAQSTQASNVPSLDVLYSVEGASYSLPTGGYTTPVKSVSDGVLPVDVTNWGVSTWQAGGSLGLRQSIVNSAGEDMIAKHGLTAYRHFTVPATTGPHTSVRIEVKAPKLPPGQYTVVLGMEQAGSGNYEPFNEVPRLQLGITVPNTPPTLTAHHPLNNALVDTLRPALWVNFLDPDAWPAGGTRSYWFELCGGDPSAPVGCVNSGWQSNATWVPPGGPLTWSKAGHWYVKLSDGNAESGRLGPIGLTPVVPQPQITSKLVGVSDGGDVPGVNPQAGNFGSTVVDAKVSVAGPALEITRTYNSQDPRTTGAFGAGWTTPLDQRIRPDNDGSGNVVVTLATGLQLRFGLNPDGTYAPPPGVNLTLVKTAADWTLRDAKGTKRVFDAAGRLVKVHDAAGNTQSLLYNGTSANVEKIKDDASGRQLHLVWAGTHVVSVSTDIPQTGGTASKWTYDYSADRLTKVCVPLTTESCTTYEYTGSAHYRSAVLDANPTAYWTLGEASGSVAKNLAAKSAGELDATYQNVNQGRTGAIPGSTDFGVETDATRNSVVIAPDDLLSKDMSFALELWFKAAPGKNGVLMTEQNGAFGAGASAYTPLLYVSTAGKLRGNVWTTTGDAQMISAGRVDDGNWHHVVLSSNLDTHRLFLDGQQIGQITGRPLDHQATNKVLVGNGIATWWPEAPDGYFPFTGSLDEVAVYRHPLSAEQVAEHHRLRAGTDRLSKVVEPGTFAATAITYDGQGGRVNTVTDRNGAVWTVGASTPGAGNTRTVTVKSTVRGDITYTYDTANGGRITERADQFGSTKWEYNAAGFVFKTTDPAGITTTTDTDARGNVVRTAQWVGQWRYKGYGYYLNTADPLDPRNDSMVWQSNGYGWGLSNEGVYTTLHDIDAAGRVTKVSYPKPNGVAARPYETYTYATGTETSVDGGRVPAGKLLSHRNQSGGVTTYTYWSSGDLAATTDPVGLRHENTYDALGRVKIRAGSMNTGGTWTSLGQTTYSYNTLSQVVEAKAPPTTNAVTNTNHQLVTTYTYDKSGRRTEETVSDAVGGDAPRTTKFGYDPAGRLTSTTTPDLTVTRQEWDTAGDRVKTIDPGNRVLEHKYDDRHLPVEIAATGAGVDPLNPNSTRLVVESRAYDPMGRVATIVDAQGRERALTYHGSGPIHTETLVQRDGTGAVTGTKQLASYRYDGAGNPITVTTAGGRTRSSVYDSAGLLMAETLDNGGLKRTQVYTRDAMGNPVAVTSQTGVAFTTFDDTAFLDPDSPNKSHIDPIGARFADNNDSWVYRITLPKPGDTVSGQNNQFTGGMLTLRLSNQFLVEASSDRTTWTELGRESPPFGDTVNTADRSYDVGAFLGSGTLYVRVRDSVPADGWGGRVESVRLTLTDSSAPTSKTTFEYDAAGRQKKSTVDNPGGSPASLVTSITRDPRGLVTSQADPTGATTAFGYNTMGALVSTTLPAADTWVAGQRTTGVAPQAVLGRNTYGEITEQRDPAGTVSRTEYDVMGRKTKDVTPEYTRPDGQKLTATSTYRYDERGLPVETVDPLGGVTSVAYDYYGRPTRRTAPDPDGVQPQTAPVTAFEYDRVGQLLKTTDPAGGSTSATYDALGNQITSTRSDRINGQTVYFTTRYGRNDAGEVEAVTSPTGLVSSQTYNAAGEVVTTTDQAQVRTYSDYDHSGRPLSTLVAGRTGTRLHYDPAGRLVRTTEHTGTKGAFSTALRTTTAAYDAAGRLSETVSAEGRISRRGYDAGGRPTSITQLVSATDPASAVTVQLGYDAVGRKTRMVDGNGNATNYTYNVWGQPESIIEPATAAHPAASDRTWTTTYDIAGRPVQEALPGGVQVQRVFDSLGRLTRQTGSGTLSTTLAKDMTFDLLGRPTKVSGPQGDTTYTWNDRSQLIASSGAAGTASFEYDGDDRLTKRVDKAGTATFTYNTSGQLSSVADPLTGRAVGYGYDTVGRLTSLGYGSGAATRVFEYDNLDRLKADKLLKPGGTPAASTTYGYDGDDLTTTKTAVGVAGEGLNSYTFDGLGRLTSWTRPDTTQESYGWDKASNRTTVTGPQGTRTTTYDARNRALTAVGGGTPDVTNTYTARGTLRRSQAATTTEYQFDAFERMTQASRDGQTTTYQYDALDRLAVRNNATFTYAGLDNNPVAMPNGATETVVVRDAAGTPLSDKTGTGAARAVLTDTGHDDVTAAFDPSTALLGTSTTFTPFGEKAATQPDQTPLGYQGGYTDPFTGHVNAHARWYDPSVGAFTSRDTWTLDPDPVTQGNRYTYGNGNPVNYNDPSGHIAIAAVLAVIGVVAIATGVANINTPQTIKGTPRPAVYACSRCAMRADGDGRIVVDHAPVTPPPGVKPNTVMPGGNVGGIGTGTGKVTVAAAAQLPIAQLNNNTPTPPPTVEQTLANANRPVPPIPGGSTGVIQVENGSGLPKDVHYDLGQAPSGGTSNCDVICQINDGRDRVAQLVWDTGESIVNLAHDIGQCTRPWDWADRLACQDNIMSVAETLAYLGTDPRGFVTGVVDGMTQGMRDAWNQGRYGAAVAEGAFLLADLVAGSHGATKLPWAKHLPSCKKNSFTGDTPVLMADGAHKPIQDVVVGDRVIATDPETGETSASVVTATTVGEGLKDLVDVTIDVADRETGQNGVLVATENHPFWVVHAHKWVNARDLRAGDLLRTSAGTYVQISAVRHSSAYARVYNLTVEGAHTYYVVAAALPVLVHNCNTSYQFGLDSRPAVGKGDSQQYQIAHAGTTEYLVMGGGEKVWADGFNRDTGEIIDAKYVGNPDRSPFIEGSNIPDAVRAMINTKTEGEFRRYGLVVGDSANPITGLRVVTNHPAAVPYFEGLMEKYGIPGTVVVK